MCRVVGDLMKSAGMRLGSVAELETYIRRPRNIGNASSIPVRPFTSETAPYQASGAVYAMAAAFNVGGPLSSDMLLQHLCASRLMLLIA